MDIQTKTKLTPDGSSQKVLTGIGVVALLAIAIWFGTQAAHLGVNLTSDLASSISGARSLFNSDEDIVLAVDPGIVASEDTFTLSWEMLGEDTTGSYSFTYACSEKAYLISPISENMGNVVFCNMPFALEGKNRELELTAILTNKETVDLTLEIHFTKEGDKKELASGETTVTVVSDPSLITDVAGAATTTTDDTDDTEDTDTSAPAPTPTPPTQTQGGTTVITGGETTQFNDPNGTPDLRIEILAIGTVTTGGNFTEQDEPLDPDDRLAVRFIVENIGTKDTGPWRFEADLPTEPRRDYRSPVQETLLPGTRVEYTLGFEDAEDDEDEITVRIELDEDNDVEEQSENNNIASITFAVEN